MLNRLSGGTALLLCLAGCAGERPAAEIDAAARRGFAERCTASRPALSGWTQDEFDRFCDCSVERSMAVLDADGRRRFVDGEPWTPEQQSAVKTAGQDCRHELGR